MHPLRAVEDAVEDVVETAVDVVETAVDVVGSRSCYGPPPMTPSTQAGVRGGLPGGAG